MFPVSRYPFIIRAFPAWSVIGVSQTPLELHVTVAAIAVPVPSTKANGVLLLAPIALFQFGCATTPATSPAPIGTSSPTKSTLSTPAERTSVVSVRFTVTVCVSPPLAPVIVSVELPAVAPVVVVTVSVELPAPLTDVGLNTPVAPVGNPLTLRFTTPLNPFTAPTVTAYVVFPP